MEEKHQETKDAELIALASLVFAEAVSVQAANDGRKMRGQAMAYDEDYSSDATAALEGMLRDRKILPPR